MKHRQIKRIDIEENGEVVFYFEGTDQGFILDEFRELSKKRMLLQKIEDSIQEHNENDHWY